MFVDSAVPELRQFPRVLLGHYPTPLEELPRLSRHWGDTRIRIKRDDCTGLGMGGNKVRQLEYYLGDAIDQGCDTVLSTGAIQSNYMRTLAAAASKLGLECHIQLEDRVPNHSRAYKTSGNRMLTALFGATIHYYAEGEDEEGADKQIREIASELETLGNKPYVVPLAPTKFPKGALGYMEMAAELNRQLDADPTDLVVVPSGSGLTHAGTLFGLRLLKNRVPVLGACVRRNAELQRARILTHCENLAEAIGIENPVHERDVWVDDRALAPGYGRMSENLGRAIKAMATREGILLDPVYSGKTLACLMMMIEAGDATAYKDTTFIHTGGSPALFAYQDDLETVL